MAAARKIKRSEGGRGAIVPRPRRVSVVKKNIPDTPADETSEPPKLQRKPLTMAASELLNRAVIHCRKTGTSLTLTEEDMKPGSELVKKSYAYYACDHEHIWPYRLRSGEALNNE